MNLLGNLLLPVSCCFRCCTCAQAQSSCPGPPSHHFSNALSPPPPSSRELGQCTWSRPRLTTFKPLSLLARPSSYLEGHSPTKQPKGRKTTKKRNYETKLERLRLGQGELERKCNFHWLLVFSRILFWKPWLRDLPHRDGILQMSQAAAYAWL